MFHYEVAVTPELVGGSIPSSPNLYVEVPLGKILNPKYPLMHQSVSV